MNHSYLYFVLEWQAGHQRGSRCARAGHVSGYYGVAMQLNDLLLLLLYIYIYIYYYPGVQNKETKSTRLGQFDQLYSYRLDCFALY